MIMPRGQQVLLPANPMFILFTLLMALFANMVVNISLVGNAAWMPDFLALVLVFWCVHQSRVVGIGVALLIGGVVVTETVFGLQPTEAQAIVSGGRVKGWFYTGSGEPVP